MPTRQAWSKIDLELPEDFAINVLTLSPRSIGGFYYSAEAGTLASGEPVMLLSKNHPDGKAVGEFGDGGTARITMPGEQGSWLCFTEDGDHLLCGVALRVNEQFGIFRLKKETGELDERFGDRGWKLTPYPEEPAVQSAEEPRLINAVSGHTPQFPDQKLRQAVNSGIAQFTLDGSLDTSFNEVGMRRFFMREGKRLFALDVVARFNGAQHDGFYYCGMYRYLADDVQAWVGAMDKNGSVVSQFADDGVWIVYRLPGHPDIESLAAYSALQAHDAVYVAGSAADNGFLVRLGLDGKPDQQFNAGKAILLNPPGYARAKAFAIAQDGEDSLVAVSELSGLSVGVSICRFNSEGLQDTSFGDNGWLVAPASTADSLAVLEDGGVRRIELKGAGYIASYPL